MKKLLLPLFMALSLLSYSKINVEIVEPITVKDTKINLSVNAKTVGKGIINVFSDNVAEDGKNGDTMVVIRYSTESVLSTTRRWIRVKNIKLTPQLSGLKEFESYTPSSGIGYISFIYEDRYKGVPIDITSDVELDDIRYINEEDVNGEYTGRLNLNVEVYKRDINKVNQLVEDDAKNEFARKHKQYFAKYKTNWKELYDNNKALFVGANQQTIDRYVYAYILDPSLKNKSKTDYDNYIRTNLPGLLSAENEDLNKLHEYIQDEYDKKVKATGGTN